MSQMKQEWRGEKEEKRGEMEGWLERNDRAIQRGDEWKLYASEATGARF